jgi:ATP-binding cassette subfamily B multidrug efflux pump
LGRDLLVAAFAILFLRPLVAGGACGAFAQHDPDELRHDDALAGASHVLRQPVGWFESDLPGGSPTGSCRPRPPRGTRCFRSSTLAAFACTMLVGAGVLMLAEADPR